MNFNWQTVADMARPFVLYSVGGSTAFSIVRLSFTGANLESAAVFVAAAGSVALGLYGAKAIEETRKSGHTAEVDKVKAQTEKPNGLDQNSGTAGSDSSGSSEASGPAAGSTPSPFPSSPPGAFDGLGQEAIPAS